MLMSVLLYLYSWDQRWLLCHGVLWQIAKNDRLLALFLDNIVILYKKQQNLLQAYFRSCLL